MTYPIDVKDFTVRWISGIKTPDDGDRELAEAIAGAINNAYYEGIKAGKKTA